MSDDEDSFKKILKDVNLKTSLSGALSRFKEIYERYQGFYELGKSGNDSEATNEMQLIIDIAKKRLDFCQTLKDRECFYSILEEIYEHKIDAYMFIVTIVDLYFVATDEGRQTTEHQQNEKIKEVREAIENMIDVIGLDPNLSMYPNFTTKIEDTHILPLLREYYYEIPNLVKSVVPTRDMIEPTSTSSTRYFGMMVVSDFNIQDSRLLSDILNCIFDCSSFEPSSASKIIKKAKKYNKKCNKNN